MRTSRGFTLTDLIVVLAAIAVAAAVAIPKLMQARLQANEATAAETLAVIARAQDQFRAAKRLDLDGDGKGEFGFLKELSGATGLRTTPDGGRVGDVLKPPALSSIFRLLDAHGSHARSGYLYRVFLPDARGDGVPETELFPVDGMVDPVLAARTWCCYAWPTRHATSGERTFFVNEAGTQLHVDSPRYSDPGRIGPANCGGAFEKGAGALSSILGAPAVGTVGATARSGSPSSSSPPAVRRKCEPKHHFMQSIPAMSRSSAPREKPKFSF
jgi:type II secretory pathway pseudopilin PulG